MARVPRAGTYALYACTAWIAGTALQAYGIPFAYVLSAVLLGFFGFLFFSILTGYRTQILLACACALSVLGAHAYAHAWAARTYEPVEFGAERIYEGKVASYPRQTEFGTGFLLRTGYGIMQAYLPSSQRVSYGDSFVLRGAVRELSDSQTYLRKDRVAAILSNPEVVGRSEGNFSVLGSLYGMRSRIRDTLVKLFPYDEASLATGLLIGGGSVSFGREFKQDMQNSGTTHLVALSGYNISILITWACILFGLFLRRTQIFWAAIGSVCLFVLMTGAESSVVRAAVMGSLLIFSQHIGRMYDFRQVVALVACFMTVCNPLAIRYDLGFLLSFLSLFGITYAAPALAHLFRNRPYTSSWWFRLSSETASAQLAVLPVLAVSFGSVSPASILANVCILPFIPAAMGLSFASALFGIVSLSAARIFSVVSLPLLSYVTHAISFFGSFRQISMPNSWVLWALYYAAFLIFIFRMRKRSPCAEMDFIYA